LVGIGSARVDAAGAVFCGTIAAVAFAAAGEDSDRGLASAAAGASASFDDGGLAWSTTGGATLDFADVGGDGFTTAAGASCATSGRANGIGAPAGAVAAIGALATSAGPFLAGTGRLVILVVPRRPASWLDPVGAGVDAIVVGFCAIPGTATSRPTTSDVADGGCGVA
jgi:hypothetical protein